MSRKSAIEFVRKMKSDEWLHSRLVALQAGLADQSLGELSRKMVELGVEAGFDISGADLRDIYRAMVDEAGVSRELADEELSAVSGGVQIFDWFIKSFEGLQVDRSRG